MKKVLVMLILLMTLLTSCIGLSSCRSIFRADKYYNVKWSSENPLIEFTVKSKEETGFNEGFLIQNEEKIEIICSWTLTNGLDVFYKSKISNGTTSVSDDDLVFNGNYKMRGKRCILTINIDHVYNHLYSTITLKMSDL